MNLEEVNLERFDNYRVDKMRVEAIEARLVNITCELTKAILRRRHGNHTLENERLIGQLESEQHDISQAVTDAKTQFSTTRSLRSGEICDLFQDQYNAMLRRIAGATEELFNALNARQTFRTELEKRGLEILWAEHPLFLVIDEKNLRDFQTSILETLSETSQKKEATNQKRQRGGTTASNQKRG